MTLIAFLTKLGSCQLLIVGFIIYACVTSRLSDFIDKVLRPYLQKVKSYLRDDIDFLTKMLRGADKRHKFLTFDISSMYTNIDNNLGQEAIQYWLEIYPDKKTRNVSNNSILTSLKILLQHNTFNFDNQRYVQIQGTAMGPIFSTLVIEFLETKLYEKFEEKFGTVYV